MAKASMVGCLSLLFVINTEAVNFDRNVPKNVREQLIQDLDFISQVTNEYQTPLHQQVFSETGSANYRQFFDSRIFKVAMGSCGGGAAVACVSPFWDPNLMMLTQNFVKFEHPAIARLMILFHEARHSESASGNWMHATCPRPFLDEKGQERRSIWTGAPLANEPACDQTPIGSYGSSAIMLRNISRFCTNCNSKVMMDADLYAQDQALRIIDAEAFRQITEDFNAPPPVIL